MDLRTLRQVTAAIRLQSITKAASQLNVAQSALSRTIRLLEEELGVALMIRHPRGVQATKDGLKFAESAETLLRLAKQLHDEARAYSSEPVGQIRFGFLPSNGDLFVGDLVADFVKRFPKVSFLLREALSVELAEALLTDKLDLALMLYDTKHQDLNRLPLFTEDMWLAGARAIWPFGTKPLRPHQLEDLPLIHAALVGDALKRLNSHRKLRLKTVIVGDIRPVARAAVHAGAGFMLMPYSWIADDIERGALAGAPVKGLEVRRGVFWRADRPQSRAAVKFVDELQAKVNELKRAMPNVIKDILSDA
ncbi:MAG: LysR family transcriptional regulator [Alphaproteobacteria bacterium]